MIRRAKVLPSVFGDIPGTPAGETWAQ